MIYKMELADSVDEMTFDLLEVPIEDKDIEGTADNTTIDGNVFTDYLWLKKQFVQKWSLMCEDDYTQLRGFYTRQWENAEVPTYKLFVGENRSETLTASGSAFQIQNGTQYDAPLTLTEITGNATQTTYSGKNLFDCMTPYRTGGTFYNLSVGTQIVAEQSSNVSITQTSNGCAIAVPSWSGAVYVFPMAVGTTYHFKYTLTSASNRMSRYTLDSDHKIVRQLGNLTSSPLNESINITLQNGEAYFAIAFGSNSATTLTLTEPQLELGSTATAYEPYVGGTPAPNPNFPQAVNTTTGENTVKITGKNLLDTSVGFTNKWINANGVEVAGNTNALFNGFIKATPNTTYTLSFASSVYNMIISEWNGSKTFVKQNIKNASTSYTITTQATTEYLRVNFNYNGSTTVTQDIIDSLDIQLELGSTATAYEPYQGEEFEVNLGKNLLNIVAGTITDAGVAYTRENDTLTAIGTSTRGTYAQVINIVGTMESQGNYPAYGTITEGNSLVLPSGTYTLSANITNTGNTTGGLYIGVGNVGSRPATGDKLSATGSKSITLAEGQRLYLSMWYEGTASAKDVNLSINQIQLEKGSTATAYAPYFAPIELAKIGTYQDRIYKNDGKWYIEKQTGKVVLDGATYKALSKPTGQINDVSALFYCTPIADAISTGLNSPDTTISDKLIPVETYGQTRTTMGYSIGANNKTLSVRLRFNILSADATYADFNTWASANPTTIYYALATPTTTEITDTTLLSQLNFIANLYGGTNNITLVGTGAQGEIGVEYTLTYEKEQVIIPETPVRLNLTDGGVINTCGCRQNVQLTMRETVQ